MGHELLLHGQRVGLGRRREPKAVAVRGLIERVAPMAGAARQHQLQAVERGELRGGRQGQGVARARHQIAVRGAQQPLVAAGRAREAKEDGQVHGAAVQQRVELRALGLGDVQAYAGVLALQPVEHMRHQRVRGRGHDAQPHLAP